MITDEYIICIEPNKKEIRYLRQKFINTSKYSIIRFPYINKKILMYLSIPKVKISGYFSFMEFLSKFPKPNAFLFECVHQSNKKYPVIVKEKNS